MIARITDFSLSSASPLKLDTSKTATQNYACLSVHLLRGEKSERRFEVETIYCASTWVYTAGHTNYARAVRCSPSSVILYHYSPSFAGRVLWREHSTKQTLHNH